jgi:lysophospholipase L1-like esterase
MKPNRFALVWLTTCALLAGSPAADADRSGSGRRGQWVNTWTSMPQLTEPNNLPPPPFTGDGEVFVDTTLRQTVHTSIGGRRIRLRFSNAFGTTAVAITSARVALPEGGAAGVRAIRPGSTRVLTFHGRPGVTIPAGAQIVSDALNFDLAPLSNLAVTIYLAEGQPSLNITSHPGSRTTSYMIHGDHVADVDLPGATAVDHWYLLSGVEVVADERSGAAVMLGDSLTDGRGSTTNMNDRWPDQLARRLRGDRRTADVAIVNQAAGGNRVLNDGLGPNALARLDRDVLAVSGVEWLLVFEGINDIGTADATPAAQQRVAADLIMAFDQIVERAHARHIAVYGATLLPFAGSFYDDGAGVREAARQTVNAWIRTSGKFDAVIDFDAAVRDPAHPISLLPAFDVGDHLHMNPAGYEALADAVPGALFGGRSRDGEDRAAVQ